ncbi:MAG: hypothetical protein KJZ90_03470 [Rhodocyclaceae bacterium]|nr:hypothetical protein [Rhodocyclaceae bacterium]
MKTKHACITLLQVFRIAAKRQYRRMVFLDLVSLGNLVAGILLLPSMYWWLDTPVIGYMFPLMLVLVGGLMWFPKFGLSSGSLLILGISCISVMMLFSATYFLASLVTEKSIWIIAVFALASWLFMEILVRNRA